MTDGNQLISAGAPKLNAPMRLNPATAARVPAPLCISSLHHDDMTVSLLGGGETKLRKQLIRSTNQGNATKATIHAALVCSDHLGPGMQQAHEQLRNIQSWSSCVGVGSADVNIPNGFLSVGGRCPFTYEDATSKPMTRTSNEYHPYLSPLPPMAARLPLQSCSKLDSAPPKHFDAAFEQLLDTASMETHQLF